MQVKCGICGKKIDKDTAYCIIRPSGNAYYGHYYCSKEEYDNFQIDKVVKQKTIDLCAEILDTHFNQYYIKTMLEEVSQQYNYDLIFNYLYDNQDYWYKYLKSKVFVSVYGEVRYFKVCLLNNLGDYEKKISQEEIQRVRSDIENVEIVNTKRKEKKRRTFDELEELF